MNALVQPTPARPPQLRARRTALVRWLGRGLETHISLPLFALLLVLGLWGGALHMIDA